MKFHIDELGSSAMPRYLEYHNSRKHAPLKLQTERFIALQMIQITPGGCATTLFDTKLRINNSTNLYPAKI